MASLQAILALAAAAALLAAAPSTGVSFEDIHGSTPPRGYVGYLAGPCRYRNISLTGCCGWLLDGSEGGSGVSMYAFAPGEGQNSPHCRGTNPAFASYLPTRQTYKCISETEGVFLSAPVNTTAYNTYLCNRYKISPDGTQMKTVASSKPDSYPACPDAVIDMSDLDAAPALVQAAGTWNIIGETQLPECA